MFFKGEAPETVGERTVFGVSCFWRFVCGRIINIKKRRTGGLLWYLTMCLMLSAIRR